ncbi:MAG TPA: Rne/Rng family ribonuclease [Bryobacteraceae bacterium]|nr:Rne/Rng family ribonuclease [Bryobacteraceae bacterium]
MSKELVISANRHETRVAILEDEQLVEIYHQRENEYSLAGSIHKGRVTRVLPGMQSAFVDIGLERDAFLYVSDFFEDNEEYDKIVTSVEDKVLKLERVAAPSAVAPAEEAPVPVPEIGAPPAVAAAETPAVAETQPVTAGTAASGEARREDQRREDHDRRGRRGRRRRGGKGRGLPESKFYSPGGRTPLEGPSNAAPASAEPAEATAAPQPQDDFFVLPGESLAKYTHADDAADDVEPDCVPPVSGDVPDEAQPELEAGGVSSASQPGPHAAATATEEFRSSESPTAVAEDVAVDSAADAIEAQAEPETETAEDADLVTTDPAEPVDIAAEAAEDSETAAEAQAAEFPETTAATAETETQEAEIQEEGPEPARIPTSLTATLREQGPRYLHRVSRRMRRRGNRGGAPEVARGPHGLPQEQTRTAQAPRSEPRAQTNGKPERGPAPSITDLLKEGQEIIVQIAKEPLGQKGARITSHIALPGRFLVYMPTVDHIGVSRKIPSEEERSRLKRVLQNNRSGIPGGFIVRTAGDGHTEAELRADMLFLYNLWLDLRQKAERKAAPALIHHDLNVVERVLRDQLTASFKNIWVDNEELYESVLSFVQRFQPALVSRVKMYTRSTPIFDEFNITAELEKALRPKVWLKSGGYIVINQTEALVAIDVNTGKFVGKSNRLEDTIVKTNTDAIKEIVRQIRLRDLGGIIVVDFIDMDERKNRQKVMQSLEEAMRADRAPYKILQFNDFGLVAITRKRVKQSLERTLCTPCPYCEGAGYVKSPQTVVTEILQEAQKLARVVEGKDVMLRVNPEVARLLKSSQNTYLQEIEEILGRTVIVKGDPQLHQEKFDMA